jgi:hypothetical protein
MKQLMPCARIFSHFSRILAFSAASISATWREGKGGSEGMGYRGGGTPVGQGRLPSL